MSPLVRLATCDAALVRRSRYGDHSAARRLAARHLDRISLLASVVGTTPEESEVLARQGFSIALKGGRPFEEALITAFGSLAAALPEVDEARGRLAVLLAEVEQRPVPEVARLLGLSPGTVDALLPRAMLGSSYPARVCRGWALASGRQGLTEAERQAGQAHLALCRRCRERLAAVDRTRAQLRGGAGGMVGVAAVAQVLPWGSSAVASGAGAVLTTKVAAGVIGVVGAAVLATAGTAAVVQQQPPHRAPAARQLPEPTATAPVVAPPTQAPVPATHAPSPTPAPTPTSLLPLTTVSPLTKLPTDTPTLPLPLPSVPIQLPTLPPIKLPAPLQSAASDLLGS